MLQTLLDLLKQGWLGRLELVNLDIRPEVAQDQGVRSVPWTRIGPFELMGVRGRDELLEWIARAGAPDGMAEYFHVLLKDGQLERVLAAVAKRPETLAELLPIVANPDASINVRIGAGAVFEEFAGQPAMRALTERLGALSDHEDARVRADACHYLALTAAPEARPYLTRRQQDDDGTVREIAQEGLQTLPD